jgi:hypothetical protein
MSMGTNLFGWHKIPPEAIIASQIQLYNDRMTAHQQAGEPVCPEIEISLGQAANVVLKMIRHVIVVIALVAESPQEIQHSPSGVLALLAEIVFEVSRQWAQEIHFRTHYPLSHWFQAKQRVWWGLARLEFEVVGYIAEEGQAVWWGPEEWVHQYSACVRTRNSCQ